MENEEHLTPDEWAIIKKRRENNDGIHNGLPTEPDKRPEPDAGTEKQLEGQEGNRDSVKTGKPRVKGEQLEIEQIAEKEQEAEKHECSGCSFTVTKDMAKCPSCGEELDWENIEETEE